MYEYLHLWKLDETNIDMDRIPNRIVEVLKLLSSLQYLINHPLDASEQLQNDWMSIRKQFREMLQVTLDEATYNLIDDVKKKINPVDIKTSNYSKVTENFTICMWTLLEMPKPLYNPRVPPPSRVTVEFSDVKLNINFPVDIDFKCMLLRVLWLKYDHLTENCATFKSPNCSKEFELDLDKYTLEEWSRREELKAEKELSFLEEQKQIDESSFLYNQIIDNILNQQDESFQETEIEKPVVKTVNDLIIEEEESLMVKIKKRLKTNVPENVVNLRKYSVVGGIIHIDLLHQPPQPKQLISGRVMATLKLPKKIKPVEFHVIYKPPVPVEAGVRRQPEEIEAELKKQETEMDKLALVSLDLPETVLWFEQPLVCIWNEQQQVWMTNDIHDVKYNEDKFTLSFRTGFFGIFGIAVNKYVNFPYQTWEIKPDSKCDSVIINITAAIIIVEFVICEDNIQLTQLQNGATLALQDQIGIDYKLPELVKIMQDGGVDIFPSFDIFCYIEGTCEKLWPFERHLYYCLAILSPAYNFTWSRWNFSAGKRSVVLQLREYLDRKKLPTYLTLLTTPLHATLIDCSEVSQTFNPNGIEGMKFYSDLYNLMEGTSTVASRKKIYSASHRLIRTVAQLLLATRVLSFA